MQKTRAGAGWFCFLSCSHFTDPNGTEEPGTIVVGSTPFQRSASASVTWFRRIAEVQCLMSCRGPQQRRSGGEHDAVHHEAEYVRFKPQHEPLGNEGARHQRGAGDQALEPDVRG
jgi:hypothetical protein